MSDNKDTFVREMFSNIAHRYDFLNRLLSLRRDVCWRRFAVRELLKGEDSLFLDVATGTGDCAIEIVKTGGKGKRIVGVDFSEEMICQGRKKIGREGLSENIRLLQTNALGLPFDDNYFDGAIVAFGIRNFSDIKKGVREMRRVIKENGRVVILEFASPSNMLFKKLYYLYFKRILPFIGGIISGKRYAYQYLPDSVMEFPSVKNFKKIMESEGLKDVKHFPLTFGIAVVYVGVKRS